ncbi:ALKBH4 family protein [Megaselia abdita]
MNTLRPCGCKGIRTCLECEKSLEIQKTDFFKEYQSKTPFAFCVSCNMIYPGWDVTEINKEHPNHKTDGIPFPGMFVEENFLSSQEGDSVTKSLDDIPWIGSQSGRRKQNFGPKTNFKKRKLKNGEFNGFPDFTKFIQEKFRKTDLLKNFQTIEQCSLEYDESKGASIDPHVDDCWIWGERVVTVNCLGDSVLTLVPFKPENPKKYNLDLVKDYESHLLASLLDEEELKTFENMVIRVPMKSLSLMVMYGPARYQFEHSVLREDIEGRRVCLAYREFTPMYLEGGNDFDKSKVVLENAGKFEDPSVLFVH